MPNGKNKYQSREARARIRDILTKIWDPIGIQNIPQAQDEYDAYAGQLAVMLMEMRSDPEEIFSYLFNIAVHSMGVPPTSSLHQSARAAVDALMMLRPQIETH